MYSIGLDILRCIAALLVFMCHFTQHAFSGAYGKWFSFGAYGVQLFFVMSGFLNMQSFHKAGGTCEYYKKRVNRFFPQYWGGLLLVIFFNECVKKNVPADTTSLYWIKYFLGINSTFVSEDVFWNNLYGYWTIGAFLLFYLLTPIIAKYVNSFYKSLAFFVIAYGVQIINNIVYKYVFEVGGAAGVTPFHELYMFAVGVVVYFGIKSSKQKVETVLFCGIFAGIGVVLGKTHYIWAAMAAVIVLLHNHIRINNVTVTRLIKTISKYSFAIYLTHVFSFDIINFCERWMALTDLQWSIAAILVTVILSWSWVNVFGRMRIFRDIKE